MLLMALSSWPMMIASTKNWALLWNTLHWRKKEAEAPVEPAFPTTLKHLSTDRWQDAKNPAQGRGFHTATQSSGTNMHLILEAGTSLKEGKGRCWLEKTNQLRKTNQKKYKIPWTKDLEGRCLGTAHKIKSVICTVLLWIYINFKMYSNILYLLESL